MRGFEADGCCGTCATAGFAGAAAIGGAVCGGTGGGGAIGLEGVGLVACEVARGAAGNCVAGRTIVGTAAGGSGAGLIGIEGASGTVLAGAFAAGGVIAGGGGVTTAAFGGAIGAAFAAGAVTLGTTGFVSVGRCGTGGRVGGPVTAACCCVIAFSTSPGLEIWDRSILVLISSGSARAVREGFDEDVCASAPARKCARTFSASCSSMELECVFFSVTPTSRRTSRMALLLTSSSLARSLIRILVIRPFFLRPVPLSLHVNLTDSVSIPRRLETTRGNFLFFFFLFGNLAPRIVFGEHLPGMICLCSDFFADSSFRLLCLI